MHIKLFRRYIQPNITVTRDEKIRCVGNDLPSSRSSRRRLSCRNQLLHAELLKKQAYCINDYQPLRHRPLRRDRDTLRKGIPHQPQLHLHGNRLGNHVRGAGRRRHDTRPRTIQRIPVSRRRIRTLQKNNSLQLLHNRRTRNRSRRN